MLRLKAILQYSNILFYIFLIVIVLSIIRCNINIKSKYNIDDNYIEGIIIDKQINDNKTKTV